MKNAKADKLAIHNLARNRQKHKIRKLSEEPDTFAEGWADRLLGFQRNELHRSSVHDPERYWEFEVRFQDLIQEFHAAYPKHSRAIALLAFLEKLREARPANCPEVDKTRLVCISSLAGRKSQEPVNTEGTIGQGTVTEVKANKVSTVVEAFAALSPAEKIEAKKAFEEAEIEQYHRYIFGDLGTKATVNGLQRWLSQNAGSRCTNHGIPFAAKALQYFRKKLGIEYEILDPRSGKWVACRPEGKVRPDGHGEHFKFRTCDSRAKEISQPTYLPNLRLIAK